MSDEGSSSTCPTFRGYRAITEVIERMSALASWYRAFKPNVEVMTLRRRDLDLLQRWPKAASLHEVFTNDGVTHWRGFTLRADRTPGRYEKRADSMIDTKAIQ